MDFPGIFLKTNLELRGIRKQMWNIEKLPEELEMQVSSLIAKKKNYLLRVNSWPAKTANIQLIAEEKEKRKTHFLQRATTIVQIPEKTM